MADIFAAQQEHRIDDAVIDVLRRAPRVVRHPPRPAAPKPPSRFDQREHAKRHPTVRGWAIDHANAVPHDAAVAWSSQGSADATVAFTVIRMTDDLSLRVTVPVPYAVRLWQQLGDILRAHKAIRGGTGHVICKELSPGGTRQ